MHISRAGEYGVLGLLHLVRQPAGQTVMIDAVSRDVAIPKSFLAKIFQDLAKAGILRSQRGAGGGFALARPADQITVLEIIEAIDGKIALQRCLSEVPDCERRDSCALCSLFEQAQDRLKEVFSRTTLFELAAKQEAVNGLGLAHAAPAAHRPATDVALPGIKTDRPPLNGSTNGSGHSNNSTLSTKESLALES
jgi:Rrf2 family protein